MAGSHSYIILLQTMSIPSDHTKSMNHVRRSARMSTGGRAPKKMAPFAQVQDTDSPSRSVCCYFDRSFKTHQSRFPASARQMWRKLTWRILCMCKKKQLLGAVLISFLFGGYQGEEAEAGRTHACGLWIECNCRELSGHDCGCKVRHD